LANMRKGRKTKQGGLVLDYTGDKTKGKGEQRLWVKKKGGGGGRRPWEKGSNQNAISGPLCAVGVIRKKNGGGLELIDKMTVQTQNKRVKQASNALFIPGRSTNLTHGLRNKKRRIEMKNLHWLHKSSCLEKVVTREFPEKLEKKRGRPRNPRQ